MKRIIPSILCAVLLFACGNGQDHDTAPADQVVIGLLSEPPTLNPVAVSGSSTQDIVHLIFLTLVEEQGDLLSFEPRLAEGWSYSADSLAITFHLREGAVWHDGEPVTAEDVRFTWQVQTNPDVGWSHRSAKDFISDVEVVDAATVTFHFERRYPYQMMDANDGVILPKHLLEKVGAEGLRSGAFGRAPVGCGPFRFAAWAPGEYIELAASDNYYQEGLPHLAKVFFRFIPDMNTQITLLETGDIDCLEGIPIGSVHAIAANPQLRLYRYPSKKMEYIFWNLEREPLANREVRRALAQAINVDEIVANVWEGMATVPNSPMHPILWAWDPSIERVVFDPGAAARTLASLGWSDSDGDGVLDKNGRAFEIEMVTNQGNPNRDAVMTLAQEYLRQIGVKVDARALEFGTLVDKFKSGDFDSCVLGARAFGKPDLRNYWHSESIPMFNAQRYRNATVDDLIDRAEAARTRAAARDNWFEAQRIIYEDQGYCFVAVPEEMTALARRFCGVDPNAIGFFVNLHEWYVSEDCAD